MHIASGDLWAGAEAMLAALAAAQFRQPGITLSAIVLNEGELARRLRELGIDTLVLPEASMSFARLCGAARAHIRRWQPRVIHTHRIKEDMLGALAGSGRDLLRVRTVHGRDESVAAGSLAGRVRLTLHRLCVRARFARTFAVSASLAAELSRSFNDVTHVSNGVDLRSLQSIPDRVGRESAAPVRVGLVGRLVPVKRIDLFLRMAAELQRAAPGAFRFHVFGDGPEQDRLLGLARDLGLGDELRFEGFVGDVAERIAALDLLYLTSDSEGLPMTVLEAMGLGTPVVAPSVGELPEVLDAGACGTLVRDQQAAAYAAPALEFLRDRAPFLMRARAAKLRLVERYSADACARAYLEQYLRLIESS